MTLQISLFDSLRVRADDGTPIRSLRPRAQRLLAFLLLRRDRPLTREQIAFTLWPDSMEQEALGTLRRALSDLRVTLPAMPKGEWIAVSEGAPRWNPDASWWLDVDAFESLVSQSTPAALHDAVALSTGELLAAWDDEWLLAERERLHQMRISALRTLVDHHRAIGERDTALALARQVLDLDPWSETGYRDLIALHYQSGDRAAALATYGRLASLLRDELGVEPMAETLALRDLIMQGATLPLLPDTVGPATSLTRRAQQDTAADLPRLIGRQTEMLQLSALWDSATAGSGRLAIVSGEAGVGKSHLALALAAHATRQGGLALIGHCYEFEQALPYQAIVEMLRSASRSLRHSDLAPAHRVALARLAPDVLGMSGSSAGDPGAAPVDLRAQLFEALFQAFLAVARSQPLLLLIEDVHWAAESTLDWLTYVAPRLGSCPLLVAITCRTDEIGAEHALVRLRRRLARQATVATLSLAPLTPVANRALVSHLSGLPDDVVGPIADRLYRETGGNPFFLHEIVRELIEDKQITVSDGRWGGAFVSAARGTEMPLPDSLRETIGARLERLTEQSRMFTQIAAVAGRRFQYDVVRKAGGWGNEPALGAVEDLLARGFVRQHEGRQEFAFAHHLVQEAIYAGLSAPRRIYIHRRLADAIAELYPDDVESLAHHFGRAGDGERARVNHLYAGERAWQLVALDDAAMHYHAALDDWPEADIGRQAEILYRLGQCQWVLGDSHAALQTFSAARTAFEKLVNPLMTGEIERLMGRVCWEQSDRDAALRHYHHALEILEQQPDSVELARAISGISQMHMLASAHREAIDWGERALALAERLGADDVAAHVLNNLGTSYASLRDTDRGLAMLEESRRRALALGLPHDAARAYFNTGEQLAAVCRYKDACATYEALLQYSKSLHVDKFIGGPLVFLTRLEWLTGQWTAALEHRQELYGWMEGRERIGIPIIWASAAQGWIHNDLGQSAIACEILEGDLAQAWSADELQTTVPHLGQLARAYIALGRDSDAANVIQEVLDWVDRSAHLHHDCIMPLLFGCRWFVERSDPDLDSARACLSRLQRADEQMQTLESRAALAEGRGMVVLGDGDTAQAAEAFREASADWDSLERRLDHMRALVSLGLATSDREDEARIALGHALEICDALAAQLDDELRASFDLSSAVRQLRGACAAANAMY